MGAFDWKIKIALFRTGLVPPRILTLVNPVLIVARCPRMSFVTSVDRSGFARIGIWLGDSFAEIAETSAISPVVSSLETRRWFHPKKSVSETLRELLNGYSSESSLKEITSGEICIATSRSEMSVARKQGSEPAVLVTSGFETWARLGPRSWNATPSLRLERNWFPSSHDKIFGLDERTEHDGTISKELKTEDLEFLIAKLELLKTKEIAISLLHAAKFPANEIKAAKFFRERGFNVTASHEIPNARELHDNERTRLTVESAFAEAIVHDDAESLRAIVKELGLESTWSIRFWGPAGLNATDLEGARHGSSAAQVRGGTEVALATAIAHTIPKETELAYFFGVEEFLGFHRQKDGSLKTELLPVQPTAQIGNSAWPFPSWSKVDRGYEPGPMLFGKSHQLTLLDILFVRDHLKGDIEGFSDRVQAKSTARIFEALFTLGKNLAEPGSRAADTKDIAEDLETGFMERLSMDLAFNLPDRAKNVYVSGPLATSILPLLERRRPDLKFKYDANLSVAVAALSDTASDAAAKVK